jgi:hypothetical protein
LLISPELLKWDFAEVTRSIAISVVYSKGTLLFFVLKMVFEVER